MQTEQSSKGIRGKQITKGNSSHYQVEDPLRNIYIYYKLCN